jgi:hypothetical protein
MTNIDIDQCKATQLIECICDYCGASFKRKKHHIVTLRKTCVKDSCGSKSCTVAKRAESTKLLYGDDCFKGRFLEKSKITNIAKYGVENAAQSEKAKDKSKKTNIERYGNVSYLGTEECKAKAKKKALEMYGVDHFSKAEEIKAKSRETSIKRHGDLFQKTKKWKDKVKKSCLEKYGFESVAQVKEFKDKSSKTLEERYGVSSPLKNEEIRERAKATLLKNYGVDSALRSSVIMERMKKTCVERYGDDHAMRNKDIKMRSMNTRLEKHGSLISNLGKSQKNIAEWINSKGFNFNPNVSILEGKELDMYDPNHNLALEYCGLYWHTENSPQPRTRSYHHDKWRRCRDKGIQLLTIFDDEWKSKSEIIKSVILSKLGVFEQRLQARKCRVDVISKDQMRSFCDLHHIQGGNKLSKVCFGLFHEEELVGVVDLGRHHRKKDAKTAILTRLCFKAGVQIVGGSSKLFKACVKWCSNNGIDNIVSWSDNRYSDGTVYEKLGFKRKEELPPDYYYVNMKNPKRRLSKQSQSKKNSDCPKGMTELDWANSRGLSRIWDCGKVRWEFGLSYILN